MEGTAGHVHAWVALAERSGSHSYTLHPADVSVSLALALKAKIKLSKAMSVSLNKKGLGSKLDCWPSRLLSY